MFRYLVDELHSIWDGGYEGVEPSEISTELNQWAVLTDYLV